jgi:hypothetical protein
MTVWHGGKAWTEVTVVRQEQYDKGPFCFGNLYDEGTLNAVIKSLLDIRESIPAEYRDVAQCQIDSSVEWDSSTAEITVSYERPETPEETEMRESQNRKSERERIDKRKAEYERLKREFE